MKGNVVDMAIGVVVGGAFGKIVTSLVNDIIMPLVGWLAGGVDLSKLNVELKGTLASTVVESVGEVAEATGSEVAGEIAQATEAAAQTVAATDVPSVFLNYGNFIQEIVNFFIIALCIFLCIRLVTRMGQKLRSKKAEEPAPEEAPAPKADDIVLLEEIRDLLKEKK